MAEKLNEENFNDRISQTEQLVLIDFYSDSCVPCKRMAPVLAELEETYAGQLYVGKVSVAYEKGLALRYEIQSAPTLLFFRNGEVVKRLTGAVKKADLEAVIRELQSV